MPFFIDVFHGFYETAIVPTFIDIVPFLVNIVPTNNLFLFIFGQGSFMVFEKVSDFQCFWSQIHRFPIHIWHERYNCPHKVDKRHGGNSKVVNIYF